MRVLSRSYSNHERRNDTKMNISLIEYAPAQGPLGRRSKYASLDSFLPVSFSSVDAMIVPSLFGIEIPTIFSIRAVLFTKDAYRCELLLWRLTTRCRAGGGGLFLSHPVCTRPKKSICPRSDIIGKYSGMRMSYQTLLRGQAYWISLFQVISLRI